MSVVLGIETTSLQASLCLHGQGKLLGEKSSLLQRSHSEFVTQALSDLLHENSLRTSQITEIAVSVGPGSFTGIRVGISLAKALGYSLQVPIWTIDSLQVLAYSVPTGSKVSFVVQNAFKNLFFACAFEAGLAISEPQVLTGEALSHEIARQLQTSSVSVAGDAQDLLRPFFSADLLAKISFLSDIRYPKSSHLTTLMLKQPELGQTKDWKSVLPLYLRGSEAEENLRLKSSENS